MKNETLRDRFFSKVDKKSNLNGCWLWTGAKIKHGYGTLSANRGPAYRSPSVSATHVSIYLHSGAWPPRKSHVCHKCDNPPCVNPAHLFVGTAKDNRQDCLYKGRANSGSPKGEAQHLAKLNTFIVQWMRFLHETNKFNMTEIGTLFGTDKTLVRKVVRRKTWKHV